MFRKIIFAFVPLLLFSLLFYIPVYGQLFNAGGKLSLAFDNIYGKKVADNYIKAGLGFGLHAQYLIDDNYSVQIELNYVQKGYKYSREYFKDTIVENVVKTKLKYNLNYLNIPIIIRYTTSDKGYGARYFIDLGPYLDHIWSATMNGTQTFTMKDSNRVEAYPFDYNIRNYLSPKCYGVTIGGGVFFPINRYSGSIYFQIRYDLGLTETTFKGDKFKDDFPLLKQLDYKFNPRFKSNNFTINAGMIYILY